MTGRRRPHRPMGEADRPFRSWSRTADNGQGPAEITEKVIVGRMRRVDLGGPGTDSRARRTRLLGRGVRRRRVLGSGV